MTIRDQIVAYAQAQEGKPYAWGATGPSSFDCSGLVYAAERAAGLNVSRATSIVEVQRGTQVARAQAAPGDLVYANGGGYEDHSGIYVGGGKMIDAPTQGQTVGVHNVPSNASFWTPPGMGPATAAEGAGSTSAAAAGGGGGPAVQQAGLLSDVLGTPSWAQVMAGLAKLAGGVIAGVLVIEGVKLTVKGQDS